MHADEFAALVLQRDPATDQAALSAFLARPGVMQVFRDDALALSDAILSEAIEAKLHPVVILQLLDSGAFASHRIFRLAMESILQSNHPGAADPAWDVAAEQVAVRLLNAETVRPTDDDKTWAFRRAVNASNARIAHLLNFSWGASLGCTSLGWAARFDNLSFGREILQTNAQLLANASHPDSSSNSNSKNHPSIVDINAVDATGRTALALATSFSFTKLLLDAGANPHLGFSPLVTKLHSPPATALLLEAGVSPNMPVARKADAAAYPISLALRMRNPESLELLLRAGANPACVVYPSALLKALALFHDDLTPIRLLLEANAPVDYNVILAAMRRQKYDVLELLCAKANMRELEALGDGNSPLLVAVRWNDMKAVRILLRHGASPDSRVLDPNMEWMDSAWAVPELQDVETPMTAMLAGAALWLPPSALSRLANARLPDGRVPLMHASADSIDDLLLEGADVSAVDDAGWSVLMHQVSNEATTDALRPLLRRDANVNHATPSGMTALMVAAIRSRDDLLRFLIDAGANVAARNAHGWTALHLCGGNREPFTGRSSVDCIITLLKAGANVNATTVDGVTPLMMQVRLADVEAVHALMWSDADITLRDSYGRTAYNYAWPETRDAFNTLRPLSANRPS
ncbi:hypothetical protein CAOG_06626 [Capsaspora owczarzaki ATCC 30864]|uniref:Uncharacterized protein n=1 Tax=Capsaspora owczarzaki (strain ATCC 30864) TaxID=595528 RepID=A0A0D2WVL6_CAPO3|nr:hypothetical protein CAOG_06626 [Capsaspora owczarzaki ATCC 30864]KJE96283.1 hypothetical protein CAOG_006626 [Capsaspora owczarzaki ATCC 30864]|eukprot:XP_004344247.1 hypothetical protein CAOG_06626 [Capsaspora owczarzaki ATCC 30864]